jgi:hypothetical protein
MGKKKDLNTDRNENQERLPITQDNNNTEAMNEPDQENETFGAYSELTDLQQRGYDAEPGTGSNADGIYNTEGDVGGRRGMLDRNDYGASEAGVNTQQNEQDTDLPSDSSPTSTSLNWGNGYPEEDTSSTGS